MPVYTFIDELNKKDIDNKEDEKSSRFIIKKYKDDFSNKYIEPIKVQNNHKPRCTCSNCNFDYLKKDTKAFDDIYKEDIKE